MTDFKEIESFISTSLVVDAAMKNCSSKTRNLIVEEIIKRFGEDFSFLLNEEENIQEEYDTTVEELSEKIDHNALPVYDNEVIEEPDTIKERTEEEDDDIIARLHNSVLTRYTKKYIYEKSKDEDFFVPGKLAEKLGIGTDMAGSIAVNRFLKRMDMQYKSDDRWYSKYRFRHLCISVGNSKAWYLPAIRELWEGYNNPNLIDIPVVEDEYLLPGQIGEKLKLPCKSRKGAGLSLNCFLRDKVRCQVWDDEINKYKVVPGYEKYSRNSSRGLLWSFIFVKEKWDEWHE